MCPAQRDNALLRGLVRCPLGLQDCLISEGKEKLKAALLMRYQLCFLNPSMQAGGWVPFCLWISCPAFCRFSLGWPLKGASLCEICLGRKSWHPWNATPLAGGALGWGQLPGCTMPSRHLYSPEPICWHQSPCQLGALPLLCLQHPEKNQFECEFTRA